MEFIPAGEIIGNAHQVRTVGLQDSSQLPDGTYQFLDMYCADPSCDCRKSMITVLHNGVHVSTINFGWESPAFYKEWMGDPMDEDVGVSMSGASIDLSSPDGVSPKAILAFFIALLDEKWIGKFKAHYAAVKRGLAKSKGKTTDFSKRYEQKGT